MKVLKNISICWYLVVSCFILFLGGCATQAPAPVARPARESSVKLLDSSKDLPKVDNSKKLMLKNDLETGAIDDVVVRDYKEEDSSLVSERDIKIQNREQSPEASVDDSIDAVTTSEGASGVINLESLEKFDVDQSSSVSVQELDLSKYDKYPNRPSNLPKVHNGEYLVVPGDTIYSLSIRFNTNVDDLLKLNNMTDPKSLGAWTVIKVPSVSDASPTVISSKITVETVSDTATESSTYSVTTSENASGIIDLKSLKESEVEQLQDIPVQGDDLSKYDNYPNRPIILSKVHTGEYLVLPGDTISSISRKFNISVSKILKINNMEISSVLDAWSVIKIE